MNNNITLLEKRAIKIVELQEQLEEAKTIIKRFIYPVDCCAQEDRWFKQQAAKFAGCESPNYAESNEREQKNEELDKEIRTALGL